MPVHNKFFLQQTSQGAKFHPGPLQMKGPILPIEVHIPTALANHFDQQNQQPPQPATGVALIDTGASKTCVDQSVITGLGVQPISVIEAGTAGGTVQQHVYPAKLRFPTEDIEVEFSSTIGVDLSGQAVDEGEIVVLIGRDLLSQWVLVYNGPGGFYTLGI